MICIARLCYASSETYEAKFTLLSTICHRPHIDQSGTPLLVWGLKRVRRRLFFSSRLLPYPAIPLCRSFAFAMTKHSSKPGRLSDHSRKTAASRLNIFIVPAIDHSRHSQRRAQPPGYSQLQEIMAKFAFVTDKHKDKWFCKDKWQL